MVVMVPNSLWGTNIEPNGNSFGKFATIVLREVFSGSKQVGPVRTYDVTLVGPTSVARVGTCRSRC